MGDKYAEERYLLMEGHSITGTGVIAPSALNSRCSAVYVAPAVPADVLQGELECLISNQWDVLERIATFSAKVRGHRLTGWKRSAHSSTADCAACSRTVTVYRSSVQPEMRGDPLESKCEAPFRYTGV